MESLKIVLLNVVAAVAYGILHTQITVRVCVEYFTLNDPSIVPIADPALSAFGWGVRSTWWVGLLLGLLLAAAARLGPQPPLAARKLILPLGVLVAGVALAALAAGVVGFLRQPASSPRVLELLEDVDPEQHAAFLAILWADAAAYLFGGVGGIAACVWVWRKRGPLAASSQPARPGSAGVVGEAALGRFLGCALGAVLAPFAVLSTYLLASRAITGFSETSDWWGLALSLSTGVGCILGLPFAWWIRASLAILYLPVAGFVLLAYTAFFVGFVFGDWV